MARAGRERRERRGRARRRRRSLTCVPFAGRECTLSCTLYPRRIGSRRVRLGITHEPAGADRRRTGFASRVTHISTRASLPPVRDLIDVLRLRQDVRRRGRFQRSAQRDTTARTACSSDSPDCSAACARSLALMLRRRRRRFGRGGAGARAWGGSRPAAAASGRFLAALPGAGPATRRRSGPGLGAVPAVRATAVVLVGLGFGTPARGAGGADAARPVRRCEALGAALARATPRPSATLGATPGPASGAAVGRRRGAGGFGERTRGGARRRRG